ncbi:eIF-5_eIF-2B-domain-containing protein [Sphaerulina musiva SO2202]|uniref:eIF-5_eIF-2B-domain-containing protein n=1 Tax=Sphaerulina musiva (strain SO2202) TaxID=692275 RepID=M3D7Z0_SPHMS|nr:eIF-5_eIF-2B-domain-containing protein [Sphaerulina musiva SO2202]EMF13979.1 eIF-5_eIF-2B-domain-containing protein [Sphaerulina musiva SO2202]
MADEMLSKRKSVAFADGQTIVDGDGTVTHDTNGVHDGDKASAATHTIENGGEDKAVDEVTAMFEGLAKKKKKKPKKEVEEGEDGEEKAEEDGEVDLSALKKKKKKKVKAPADDFEKQLAEAGAAEGEDEVSKSSSKGDAAEAGVQDGDIHGGTGIWAHGETKAYNYESLLSRFFVMLHDSHPDLASSGGKTYKIPPPQCLREGNKKTIFANIADICKRMKRTDEHVTQYLFAELGTSGSVDGSRRLVIKGRFQQKQIENVLRRYIVEYVTCKTCRSPDTELSKGENRLYFVTCNSCASRRSVTAIKSGFSAQVGKRKRMQG